jgi:acetylornithine deacetylase/succinyl-diaminopimelate desuccinylase-like protein
MQVFQGLFPGAHYILTGCAFLVSNAHTADENLDLEYCRKVTTVIAEMLHRI